MVAAVVSVRVTFLSDNYAVVNGSNIGNVALNITADNDSTVVVAKIVRIADDRNGGWLPCLLLL